MANTQEFIDALKEADKVAFIDSLIAKHAGSMTTAEKATLGHILATKDANLDTMTDNIQVAFNRIAALGLDASGNNLMSTKEIELLGAQVVPTDPALALASKKLMTIGSVFKALNDFKTVIGNTYETILGNPTKDDQILSSKKDGTRSWVDVASGGTTPAEKSAIAANTAKVTYPAADKAKVAHISVTKDVDLDNMATLDDVSSVGGLFQFNYKVKVGTADATPTKRFISFDNADPKLATKMYFNKNDFRGTDMSLFLKSLKLGDWINLHDNNDINDFVAYDVIGAATQTGDIFTIPVKKYDDNGTLTDGEHVFVHWQRDEAEVKLITDVADIVKAGVYSGTDVTNAPVQGDIIIEAYMDAKGEFDLSCKGADMRRYEGGMISKGTIHWGAVAPNHLFGTTDPDAALGDDGDIFFLTS